MEVLNIAKIKDGLFIGDKTVGTNISILMQFKITHVVNTAGNQIPYTFETAGIKYLTLNWVENPTNNLIYIKDDTAKKILNFIDNSLKRGSGLMVISVKGHNRACVAIIVYLMKKYNWSLSKSREYLSLKKHDIFIKKSFLNQLISFEEKLNKKGNNLLINGWNTHYIKDEDELLMNNTYLNEKQLTKKNYLNSKQYINSEINKKNEKNEIIKIKRHIEWADQLNPYNIEKKPLILKCDINQDLFFQKKVKPITNHIKMQPVKSCIKSSINLRVNNANFDINNKRADNKQTIFAVDKKTEKEERNHMNTQILKNKYFVGSKPPSRRKYTYDDKDNDRYKIKENILDNFNKIIHDEKKIVKNLFKDDTIGSNSNSQNENEKNNNDIKEDNKKLTSLSGSINYDNNNNKEFNNNIHFFSSQKQINNFINENKYSIYFHNSYANNKKRGVSAKKDKNNNSNTRLLQNKKYYLGKPNSKTTKKQKENEKDLNIIPTITHNNTFQTLNYEYNLNFHNNRMLIRSLLNDKEIRNNIANYNNSMGDKMNNKNKKRQMNSLEIKNNNRININDSNVLYRSKNATIFNKFNSYTFHPSEPVKINNKINSNVKYRLAQSHENNNSMKAYDNLNDYDEISKGINTVDKIIHKHSRPLSAKKNNTINKNINYYLNQNKGFSPNNDIFLLQKRAPSPIVQDFKLIKNISHFNNKHNNRYNSAKPKNNAGSDKKIFKK